MICNLMVACQAFFEENFFYFPVEREFALSGKSGQALLFTGAQATENIYQGAAACAREHTCRHTRTISAAADHIYLFVAGKLIKPLGQLTAWNMDGLLDVTFSPFLGAAHIENRNLVLAAQFLGELLD